jgi:cobalt-zinc-cadmium efflux system protein
LHAHDRSADRRRLAIALGLIAALMGVEVAGGILAHSVALLADAGHMLTDAAALAAALAAAALAARPARGPWTFGLGRAEILAAQGNGLVLLLVTLGIVYSAARRLAAPPHVHGGIVVGVALVGVAVNLVATLVLSGADRTSLNVRGAFLHVATDLAAFVGTAIAGALVLVTGWSRFDPIAGLLVAALMLRSSWSLLRDSGRIFLEAAPAGIDPDAVAATLAGDLDVVEVHDLHVWTVTSGFPALAAHVLVSPDADCHAARRRLEQLLTERFGLRHTTLQVDHVARRSQVVSIERRGPDR